MILVEAPPCTSFHALGLGHFQRVLSAPCAPSRLALMVQVLTSLRQHGLEQSTIVVFFSDHGFTLGERGQWGKRSLFEVRASALNQTITHSATQ